MIEHRSWDTGRPGPRLIVLGGVHGDEPCGTVALDRLSAELDAGVVTLARGALTLVPRANPLACERGTRAGERNLNRSFVPLPQALWTTPEDGVTAVLAGLISRHDVLLDLHSASSPTDPFAMIGLAVTEDLAGVVPGATPGGEPFAGAALELGLAAALDVAVVVEGWFDVYDAALPPTAGVEDRRVAVGTNEYARTQGIAALTVECGQHEDPVSSVVADDVARRTLRYLDMTDGEPEPTVRPRVLRTRSVVHRRHDGDALVRPWHSFEEVPAGEVVGVRADGDPVVAPEDGAVMFPDDDADIGEEWFYLAVQSSRSLA